MTCDARSVDLLEKMATFARIVEAGSLAAAARQLRVSPAAVSRQLAALEAKLGAPLILRTTRRFAVTELGREYYQRCRGILRAIDDAQALGRTHGAAQGLLTVSAPVTYGLARISPHVPALLTKHRGLEIDLRLEDRLVDLVGEGVDVAVRAGVQAPDSDALIAHPLDAYERVLVAAPAYVRRAGEPRGPEALVKHDVLLHLPGEGLPGTWRFRRHGEEVAVRVSASFRSNAPYALREAAVRGAGLALLPAWLVAAEVERGELRVLLPDWHTPVVTVSAIHRAELRGTPRVRVFIEHLRKAHGAIRGTRALRSAQESS